ncbi:MAG: CPBP family glutamic-type intramembrane protease [Pseudomonadota bacterium]
MSSPCNAGPRRLGTTPGRALGWVAIYAVAVLLVAGAIGQPTHALADAIFGSAPPLHEWVSVLLKALAVFGSLICVALLGLRWRDALALRFDGAALTDALNGFIYGFVSVALVFALLLALGVRSFHADIDVAWILDALFKAALTAALVSAIEELWFRGALTALLAPLGSGMALMSVAAIYASLHFVRPDLALPAPHAWSDGFVVISGMFDRLHETQYGDSWLALLVAGIVLGLVRQRSGCIAGCWGWHAGWVFAIQFGKRLCHLDYSPYRWLVGVYDGVIGVAFIAVTALALWLYLRGQRRRWPSHPS